MPTNLLERIDALKAYLRDSRDMLPSTRFPEIEDEEIDAHLATLDDAAEALQS